MTINVPGISTQYALYVCSIKSTYYIHMFLFVLKYFCYHAKKITTMCLTYSLSRPKNRRPWEDLGKTLRRPRGVHIVNMYLDINIHRMFTLQSVPILVTFINFNKKESFCPFFLTVPTSCILYFTFQSLFSFSKSLGFNYILGFNFIRVYHFIICSNFITRLYLSQEITYIYGCWYL